MLLFGSLVLVLRAEAGSGLPPPPTLAEQLREAPIAGEYRVVSSRNVVLEDGWTVTHVDLEAVTSIRGTPRPTIILPGGIVNGQHYDPAGVGPPLAVGDVVFVMLRPAVDLPGLYVIRYGFQHGLFRRVESERGWLTQDGAGRIIAATPCDGAPIRAVPPVLPDLGDLGERGQAGILLPDLFYIAQPETVGILWDDVISELVACGEG